MKINNLNLKEKIGQMLIIGLDFENPMEKIDDIILNVKPGGILLYKKNYKTYEEMIEFINYIKTLNSKVNKIPLFIAIDQEGGRVNRMPPEFKNIPSPYRLTRNKDESIVKEAATITGDMLYNSGINMDLAPVLDVKRGADNSAIGDRAFSSEVENVVQYGITYMKELQSRRVIPVVKHFPGHGLTNVDSHFLPPIINEPIEKIEKEMLPFKEAINANVDAILIGHLYVKGMTEGIPATMSKAVVNYIREKLGFNGVIVSDDMRMKSVKILYGKNRAVKRAVLAGNDIVIVKYVKNDRLEEIIEDMVKKNYLSEEQINEHVSRILNLKSKYGISDTEVLELIDLEKYNKTIQRIINTCAHLD